MTSLTLIKRRIQGQSFEGQSYENLDLSCMAAYGSKWVDCSFVGCDMEMADLQNSRLEDVRFVDCTLNLSNFSNGSQLRRVVFESCKLKMAAFSGIHPMDDVRFLDCSAQYASFFNSTVRQLLFSGTNLHGADLRFMENHVALFQDCNLWGAHITLGCQIFGDGVGFDERSVNLFLALAARKHPNPEIRSKLEEMAGAAVGVVDRLVSAPEAS